MGDRRLDEPESGSNITRTQNNTGAPNPLSRQEDIQGRQQVATVTPEIGALSYDFDDSNGVRAVDIIEISDLQHQVNNIPRHDDLIDTI